MFSKRSSSLIMFKEEAEPDRKIEKFPPPYNQDLSPYKKSDFHENTLKKCSSITSNILNICKVIVIGDVSVGKTCIVNRFCKKLFDSHYKSTIGVDFEVERFDVLGVPYNMQIWDTAGQERFKSIAQSYYRGAHAVIVVFDLNDMKTLPNTKNWLTDALLATSSTNPFIFLVGTKRDLLGEYAFKHVEAEASKMAKKLNAEFWPVSSKTGLNIDNLFIRTAALTFDKCIRYESKNQKPKIGHDLISFKKNEKAEREPKCFSKCQ